MFHIHIRNLDMYKTTEIRVIKTVDTTLLVVSTETCFDPKGSPSGQIIIKTHKRLKNRCYQTAISLFTICFVLYTLLFFVINLNVTFK
jgi:hypothetical protein